MEMLVRNANDKYMKSKVCGTWSEAIKRIVAELMPYMKKMDTQIFRETKLWTEGCDMIFSKKYNFPLHKIVVSAYRKYSGAKCQPGEPIERPAPDQPNPVARNPIRAMPCDQTATAWQRHP